MSTPAESQGVKAITRAAHHTTAMSMRLWFRVRGIDADVKLDSDGKDWLIVIPEDQFDDAGDLLDQDDD